MVYTVLMHFALLVIAIINRLQQVVHFGATVYVFFCTSTLDLFISFSYNIKKNVECYRYMDHFGKP